MQQVSPLKKSVFSNVSPSQTVGPGTQEFKNMKIMILTLQLDLQEERTKREYLEEKMRKFEVNLPRQSKKTPQRKWQLSDMRVVDEEIQQSKSRAPTMDRIKDVDEKIADLRSDFDVRLLKLDQSLLEIQSILENNPVDCLKSDKKSLSEAGPSKDKDYNRFLYKKLERGIFPRQFSLKSAIMKSVDELLHKPWAEKTEIETIMDQYYLENLPPAFLRPDDIVNEDHTQITKF